MQLRKRIVSLFSLALCLAVLFTAVPAGAEMEFDIESITTKHILLMDAETGSVPVSYTHLSLCALTGINVKERYVHLLFTGNSVRV